MKLKGISNQINKLYKSVEESAKGKPASLWLNLGFWETTNNVQDACVQLFNKTIEHLKIQGESKILDVGFGYGIQDIHLAEKFPKCIISGVNVVEFQINFAKKLVKENRLENRISLYKKDATATAFEDKQFDFIIAIESAFHFNTRELFFKESYRLLKPGGKIAIADCLPPDHFVLDNEFKIAAKRMVIPLENCYNIREYENKMQNIGFENIVNQDITKSVLPKAALEMFGKDGWRATNNVDENTSSYPESELLKKFVEVTTIGKYYIITASK